MSGTWTETRVGGHPCFEFAPTQPNPHGYMVLYLHGVHLGRLADQPAFGEQFERHGLPVVAPVTQRSWWSDRICEEFDPRITAERHVLDAVLAHLARRGSRPPQIGLLGTSMGGQGALRLAYKHPNTFPVVAAISPAIDFQLRIREGSDQTLPLMYRDEEDARQDTATLHIHPLNWPRHQFFCCDPDDPWWESSERLRMKLFSLGVPHECDLETQAGGHGAAYYGHMAQRAVGFLAERLERERLRVP